MQRMINGLNFISNSRENYNGFSGKNQGNDQAGDSFALLDHTCPEIPLKRCNSLYIP